jgi:peptide/nickel transport system permease protein
MAGSAVAQEGSGAVSPAGAAGAPVGAPALAGGRRRQRWLSGLWLLGVIAAIAIVGPLLTGYDPEQADPLNALQPPSSEHWFGTNNNGADVFSRVVHAARLDLFIGFTSVALAFLIATPLGAAAGYSRHWWAGTTMRFMDFLQSFPIFVLAMAFVAFAGPSLRNVIIVLAVLFIPIFVRVVRSEVLAMREANFIEAARCVGNSDFRVITRHVLPNVLSTSLAQASVNIGWALLVVAGISFIGAGIQPPTPEWGLMISEGAENIVSGQWWVALFPGIALGLAVLAFALAGDTLRDHLDVRTRSR